MVFSGYYTIYDLKNEILEVFSSSGIRISNFELIDVLGVLIIDCYDPSYKSLGILIDKLKKLRGKYLKLSYYYKKFGREYIYRFKVSS